MNKIIKIKWFLLLAFLVNVSAFSTDTDILWQVKKRQAIGLRNEAISYFSKASCAAAATFAAGCYLPESVIGPMAPMAGMGMLYMVKDKVAELASWCGVAEESENMKRAKRLNELEQKFELSKSTFLEFNRRELSRLILDSRRYVGFGLKRVDGYEKSSSDRLLLKVEHILKLPVRPSRALSNEELDEALSKLNTFLSTYSDGVHDSIIAAAIRINNLSASYNPSNSNDPAKASFWFAGGAGVGKTETAEMLAKALKRPFCKLNLATTPMENILGKPLPEHSNEVQELGMLAKCFVDPDFGDPAIDPIIFMDEVHDVLNNDTFDARRLYSLLKLITEGRETEIREYTLGIKLNLSHAVFIFGSNTSILNDAAGALATRMTTIRFDDLSEGQKVIIGKRHFERLAKLHKYEYIESNEEKSIRAIVERDKSPGARVLINVIEAYIIHKQACSKGALRCTEFDIKTAIINSGGVVKQNSTVTDEVKS